MLDSSCQQFTVYVIKCASVEWASYQIRKIAGCACTGNASRTCRDACLDRVPGIPGAYATRNYTFLARVPCKDYYMLWLAWLAISANYITGFTDHVCSGWVFETVTYIGFQLTRLPPG